MLLNHSGLDSGSATSSLAFLVNIANLFETTVVRAIHDSGVAFVPKAAIEVHREDATGSLSRHASMSLDVLLPGLPGGPLVVDAKYKTTISASNLQQMVTYCWVKGARRAVLIVPSGLAIDRRAYRIPAAGQEHIRVEIAELELGARSVAGWRNAAENLLGQILHSR